MSDPGAGRCVYVVASAAPPVLGIGEFVRLLQDRGRQVCLIATPTAASWLDVQGIGASTGCSVRTRSRLPHEADSLPKADAVVVAPATFNTINKWAAGISDSLALGVLNELLGIGVPITVVPCVKAELRRHPAYAGSVELLSAAGAVFLDPDTVTSRGEDGLVAFDWSRVLRAEPGP